MSKTDDRAIAMVTAALLGRGRMLHHVSLLLLAVALWLIMLKGGRYALPPNIMLVLGAAEFWYALRVALDADLFDGLASAKADTAEMDKALVKLGLMGESKGGRSMEDRAKGGLRLLQWQALCLAGQILALVACIMTR